MSIFLHSFVNINCYFKVFKCLKTLKFLGLCPKPHLGAHNAPKPQLLYCAAFGGTFTPKGVDADYVSILTKSSKILDPPLVYPVRKQCLSAFEERSLLLYSMRLTTLCIYAVFLFRNRF